MMKRFSQLAWLLGAAVLLCMAVPGFADSVTFTTTGTFSGGACTGLSSCSPAGTSGVTLSFEGITNGTVTLDQTGSGGSLFTFTSLGSFDASAGSLTGFNNVNFTLNIDQTDPSNASGSLLATLNGSIKTTSSGTEVVFSNPTSITLGGVTYKIASFTPEGDAGVVLSPSTTNGGATSLQGKISEVAVPEPSAIVLLGTGLLSLAGIRKRLFAA